MINNIFGIPNFITVKAFENNALCMKSVQADYLTCFIVVHWFNLKKIKKIISGIKSECQTVWI